MTGMHRLLIPFIVAILLSPIAARADTVESNHSDQMSSLQDLLREGARALGDAVSEGLALLEDHVALHYRVGPGSAEGEETARFQFHIFPNGKGRSSDRYGIEGSMRYWPQDSPRRFRFDLQFIEPSVSSPDYI